MTEEKDIQNNDEVKKEEASNKEAEVKAEEKEELDTEETISPKTGPELEELPEEVKKKLESRKNEKAEKKSYKKKKKKVARKASIGMAFVNATYNNTIVTLTDMQGNVLSWASAGIAGFKGAKKSTPYAASIITRIAVERARQDYGLEEVSAFIKGVGTGRESAVRALNANGLYINSIKDITPVPHNGCRPKKPRRV